jgi:hypothetical protein
VDLYFLSVCRNIHSLTSYSFHTSHSARKLCNQRELSPLSGARDKVGKIIIIWQCVCISLPATLSTPLTEPGNFAIKENCPPFQELETLSLSGSMRLSAYLLQFPHLSLSQETLQSKRSTPPPLLGASDKRGQIIII